MKQNNEFFVVVFISIPFEFLYIKKIGDIGRIEKGELRKQAW